MDVVSANDTPAEAYINSWEFQVGRFVLAFGSIEHTVILLLQLIPGGNDRPDPAEQGLAARLKTLANVLSASGDPEDQELLAEVTRVRGMVSDRNLVAHNSISFDIYQDGDRVVFDSHLVSARNRARKLTLQELAELASAARERSLGLINLGLPLMHRYGPAV